MNRFFQRLLSRFFRDHLSHGQVVDEREIRDLYRYVPGANPKKRAAPRPRPDFAWVEQNGLRGFLDAKYRDVWQKGFSQSWLYQLSIYALSSPSRVCVMLYSTTAHDARDECIELRQPFPGSAEKPAFVILRPVPLVLLGELLADKTASGTQARRSLAERLVSLAPSATDPSASSFRLSRRAFP